MLSMGKVVHILNNLNCLKENMTVIDMEQEMLWTEECTGFKKINRENALWTCWNAVLF